MGVMIKVIAHFVDKGTGKPLCGGLLGSKALR